MAKAFIDADWRYALVNTGMFANDAVLPSPHLGDRVYFMGLLSFLKESRDEITPMVRSGTIGRLNQKEVPVKWGSTHARITAHLIDCRSYGGFSGAPCFIQASVTEYRDLSKEIPGGMKGNVVFEKTLLLGLVSGHFDQRERADVTGDDSLEVRTRVNSGVGLVTPVRFISEVLQMEELAASRQETLAEIEQMEADGALTATNDGQPGDPERPSEGVPSQRDSRSNIAESSHE